MYPLNGLGEICGVILRSGTTNLNMARALVSMRGGPAVLLARSSKLSSESSAGVSRARLFVEIISVYDIFGKAYIIRANTSIFRQQNHRLSCHGSNTHTLVTLYPILVVCGLFIFRAYSNEKF